MRNQVDRTGVPVGLYQTHENLQRRRTIDGRHKQAVDTLGRSKHVRQMQLEQPRLIVSIEEAEPRVDGVVRVTLP
jgi:hypothetical protein